MLSKSLLAFVAIGVLLLSGCAASPYTMEHINAETIDDENKIENAKRAWLGRELISADTRKRAIEPIFEIEDSDDIPERDVTARRAASFAGDVLSGTSNSNLGGALSMGAALLGTFLEDDGSVEVSSGMFLPATYEGVDLNTQDLANKTAIRIINERLNTLSKASDLYEYRCLIGCEVDSFESYVLMKRKINTNETEYAVPEMNVLSIKFSGFLPSTDVNIIDNLATESDVKWFTGKGGFLTLGLTEVFNPEEIDFYTISKNEANKILQPGRIQFTENSHIGRKILRHIYSDKMVFKGDADKKYFAHDGEVYYFFSNGISQPFSQKYTN